MKNLILVGFVFAFFGLNDVAIASTQNDYQPLYTNDATRCPNADALNHYIEVPLFHDLKKVARVDNIPGLNTFDEVVSQMGKYTLSIYFELMRPYDPNKELLILIPGGPGGNHGMLHHFNQPDGFFNKAIENFNIIAMDHRGVGCSRTNFPDSEPFQSLFMRYAAADIDLIRKHLAGDNGKINVLGYSYGSLLAQTYALLFPDNINRLVLGGAFSSYKDFARARQKYENFAVSSVPGVYDKYIKLKSEQPELANKFMHFTVRPMYSYAGRTQIIPSTLDQLLGLVDQKKLGEAEALVAKGPGWILPWMTRSIACGEIFPSEVHYEGEFDLFPEFSYCTEFNGQKEYFNYTPVLQNITSPTLIWGGTYDHVTTAEAMVKMNKRIPNSHLYLDPHLGHSTVGKEKCFFNMMQEYLLGASWDKIEDIGHSPYCTNAPKLPEKDSNEKN